MVRDQHEGGNSKDRIQRAGGIGHDQPSNTQTGKQAHRHGNTGWVVAFVEVETAALKKHRYLAQLSQNQLATVSRDGRLGESGYLAVENPAWIS